MTWSRFPGSYRGPETETHAPGSREPLAHVSTGGQVAPTPSVTVTWRRRTGWGSTGLAMPPAATLPSLPPQQPALESGPQGENRETEGASPPGPIPGSRPWLPFQAQGLGGNQHSSQPRPASWGQSRSHSGGLGWRGQLKAELQCLATWMS